MNPGTAGTSLLPFSSFSSLLQKQNKELKLLNPNRKLQAVPGVMILQCSLRFGGGELIVAFSLIADSAIRMLIQSWRPHNLRGPWLSSTRMMNYLLALLSALCRSRRLLCLFTSIYCAGDDDN